MNELVQWQVWDEKTEAVFPWFTHPFLDWLEKQDLSDKHILEFGGGRSSRWWRKKSKWVTTVESNKEWAIQISKECREENNGIVVLAQVNEGDQERYHYYVGAGDKYGPYDIIVVDGIFRHECVLKALTQRPVLLIHDNYQQDGFVCPATEEVLKPYEINNYIQEDHTDNHGKNWATAYWDLK